MRKSNGFRMDIKLNGADELRAKLAAIGNKAAQTETLQRAARAGGQQMLRSMQTNAPGGPDGVVMIDGAAKRGMASVELGLDREHWYKKFAETGVQSFEIDMVKRRTKRSAIDRAKSAKKGKTVKVRGRKISGGAQAMVFDGTFSRHTKRGGIAAAPFMRPAFDRKRGAALDAFGDSIRDDAITAQMES
jgi:hypothetical protein